MFFRKKKKDYKIKKYLYQKKIDLIYLFLKEFISNNGDY